MNIFFFQLLLIKLLEYRSSKLSSMANNGFFAPETDSIFFHEKIQSPSPSKEEPFSSQAITKCHTLTIFKNEGSNNNMNFNRLPIPTQRPHQKSTHALIYQYNEIENTQGKRFESLSADNSFLARKNVIEFFPNGYMDGDSKVTTIMTKSSIVLIKVFSNSIILKTDGNKPQNQDKYLSFQRQFQQVTIDKPTENGYGKGSLGIHPNSMNPTVKLPVLSSFIPLNIYNDKDSVISFDSLDNNLLINSIFIQKVTATAGTLTLKTPTNVETFHSKEINIYGQTEINIYCKEIKVNNLTLFLNSRTIINKLNIIDTFLIKGGSSFHAKEKVAFNEESTVILSDSSFIDFESSIVSGVCKKLKLITTKAAKMQNDFDEKVLICGRKFNCEKWCQIFEGNDVYLNCKCEVTSVNQNCLVAFNNDTINSTDGSNVGDGEGGSPKMITVIVIVVASIVIVACIVVIVYVSIVLYKKKKQRVGISDSVNENSYPKIIFESNGNSKSNNDTEQV